MGKKQIAVMITAFRDGFQSVLGARVLTEDFLPALEASVEAGLSHFEVGGGARFQSLYFYCNEDAFAMMDSCRSAAGGEANLQTLARGINVVGLDSQSSDIIKLHARLFKKHGISTIRNFDALNDVDNLDYSGRCITEAGLKHEICVTLMGLPPGVEGSHTPEFYARVLKNILDAGIPFDSVCFKDASGTATPNTVYHTLTLARKMLPQDFPLRFHTHETAGTSILACKAALDGGANAIDLSMVPVSGGTCQPDIVAMWHALRGTDYDLGVDIKKVLKAEEVLKHCLKNYFLPPEASRVEPMIPFSPMPGGALTANTQMMRDNNMLDKFPEIIAAMGEVVEKGGYATSVTPVSQFYFQQALNNVIFEPWEKIAEGYGKMVLGYFGRTPVPPDPEVIELSRNQIGLEPTTRSPRLINDEDPGKGRGAAEALLKSAGLPLSDENVFIAATCKEKGITYLKGEARVMVRKQSPAAENHRQQTYAVSIDGREYSVRINDKTAVVNGKSYNVDVQETTETETENAPAASRRADAAPTPPAGPVSGTPVEIKAPMPGSIIRILTTPGARVASGDTLLVLESMKMETDIKSTSIGSISAIEVSAGDQVAAGQILVRLN
jgi:pyruvate carboxylase subunit B